MSSFLGGGGGGGREALEKFWRRISEVGTIYTPLHSSLNANTIRGFPGGEWLQQASYAAFDAMTRTFSPYQFNPFNMNPLRDVLEECVNFDEINDSNSVKLFICATSVRDGKPRIFRNDEVTVDAVLASACLPILFQAVEIGGEAYWDGGYIGNPALYPLIYETETLDVLIVHVNPIVRNEVPKRADEIMNRINEVSFNSSLVREMRAIAFVQKLVADGWLKDEHADRLKVLYIHAIRSDAELCGYGVQTKLRTDWEFLTELRELGRAQAGRWLEENYDAVGNRQTVDIRADYL